MKIKVSAGIIGAVLMLSASQSWAVTLKLSHNQDKSHPVHKAIVDSICQCNTPFNYLFRCFELQCLSRSVV